jgi:hypothetical protein
MKLKGTADQRIRIVENQENNTVDNSLNMPGISAGIRHQI